MEGNRIPELVNTDKNGSSQTFFFARGNAIGVMADRAKGMILDEKSDSGL